MESSHHKLRGKVLGMVSQTVIIKQLMCEMRFLTIFGFLSQEESSGYGRGCYLHVFFKFYLNSTVITDFSYSFRGYMPSH